MILYYFILSVSGASAKGGGQKLMFPVATNSSSMNTNSKLWILLLWSSHIKPNQIPAIEWLEWSASFRLTQLASGAFDCFGYMLSVHFFWNLNAHRNLLFELFSLSVLCAWSLWMQVENQGQGHNSEHVEYNLKLYNGNIRYKVCLFRLNSSIGN